MKLNSSRLTLGTLALSATFAAAQLAFVASANAGNKTGDKGAHARRGEKRGAMKALNLSDSQKSRIKAIMQAQRPRREAIRNDASLDKKARRAQMKSLHAQTMAQIRPILTSQQRAQMDAAIAERKANHKNRKR